MGVNGSFAYLSFALTPAACLPSLTTRLVGRFLFLLRASLLVISPICSKLEKDRSLLKLLSENCKERQMELSWEEKAKVMVEWYKKGKML